MHSSYDKTCIQLVTKLEFTILWSLIPYQLVTEIVQITRASRLSVIACHHFGDMTQVEVCREGRKKF